MLSTIQLCQHIGAMLHIPIHLYEENGEEIDTGCAESNQEDPLITDPEFAQELLGLRVEERPVIYYEANCVLYAVIPANGDRTIILGPACYDTVTRNDAAAVAELHGLKHPDSYSITYNSLTITAEAILMLFHSYSDNLLTREELLYQSTDREFRSEAREGAVRLVYDHRENSTSHNSYAQEVREQKAVREGNVAALKESWKEVQTGQIGRLARDEITHYRNLAVVVITLASRSAIEGGVLPEVSYSLADMYTQRLQDLSDPAEITKLFRSAEVHYTELVRDTADNKSNNLYVRKCKELIHSRLHEHIYEEDLAAELGITRSYLSQVFLREEGMHLSEYVLRSKVKASEYLLMDPSMSLGNIAATYGFSSQSHYGQVFKRFNGVSPGKFREQNLGLK